MSTIEQIGQQTTNHINNFGRAFSSFLSETQSSTTKMVNKTGIVSVFDKLIHFKSLDKSDLKNIIVFLIALICVIVIVFIIPKFNKNADLEKKILDCTIVKVLVCCFLLYAFYIYDIKVFGCIAALVIFIYWLHHGYTVESYGPIKPARVGSEFTPATPAPGSDEVIISKPMPASEIITPETKGGIIDTISEKITSLVKDDDELIDEDEFDDTTKENFTPCTNDTLSIYDKQGKIFDQRDFMIMPEQAPERNTMIDRLYQSTKCNCENKPTSMIDREIM